MVDVTGFGGASVFFFLSVLMVQSSFSSEGMWRPDQLTGLSDSMTEMGLRVAPEALSKVDGSVLGAIVDMKQCSGAFVSEQGLMVTSYHCIGASLQFASAEKEDLFENGFHAKQQSEERWGGPGAQIQLTLSAENVTEQVLAGTKKLLGSAYYTRIEENTTRLVERCETSGDYRCRGGGLR